MLDAIIVILFILAVAGMGYNSIDILPPEMQSQVTNIPAFRWVTSAFGALVGVAIGLLAQIAYRRLENRVREMPVEVLLTRSIGLVIALLVALLMLAPLFLLPTPSDLFFIKPLVAILATVMFSYLGVSLADTHGRAFLRLLNPNNAEAILVSEGIIKAAATKVLDTSCIIDGRIEEILATGFIEGQIIVPQFVLQELQQLADISNDMKRMRGRRGLDILNSMKKDYPERIIINSADYDDVSTVDAKLVRFTQEINGTLLTNDYNLSKVAVLQKVVVLNINDLAQAIRPLYLPGDSLELKVIKEGKEATQGIGYLNDGTMVVVEEGRSYVGKQLLVIVTSALQTSAGRMIFARPQSSVLA
jgi:uncharacterized protein YacL